MEEKKAFGQRLEDFFAGRGFYIVLLLCVAVIGVSVWSMLSADSPLPPAENGGDLGLSVAHLDPPAPVSDGANEPPATRIDPEEPIPALMPEPEAEPSPAPAAPEPAAEPAAEPAPEAQSAAAVDTAPSYFVWPVVGTVENGYAMTALVYDRTMHDWRTHDGLDIAAGLGDQVRAAAGGTVKSVYYDERYGSTVVVSHGGGLESVYANLAGTPAVSEGEAVSVGQVIGAVGDTALFESGEVSHLHFAMTRDGQSVDPGEYLP